MATAAGATIGSCFSTATNTTASTKTSCISITNSKKSDFVLRIACKKLTLSSSSLSSSLITAGISHKWRRWENFKIFATVEQEEVSSAVVETENVEEVVNEKEVEEEEKEEVASSEEGVSSEEVVGEDQSTTTTTATATKLYFGNLPYNCDSAQLAGIVQEYGSPEMVEVLYDKATGRSRGFAFVTMSSIEDAEAVINSLEGSEYGGRTLRVNFADKPKPKEPLYPESEFKLFVGNLSWNVTSESLIQAFQEYGNVVGARVLYDGETGRSRGYGFVCYSTKEEMDIALDSLNGVALDGREMRVSLATGKKN